jgi:hypothetical protein
VKGSGAIANSLRWRLRIGGRGDRGSQEAVRAIMGEPATVEADPQATV